MWLLDDVLCLRGRPCCGAIPLAEVGDRGNWEELKLGGVGRRRVGGGSGVCHVASYAVVTKWSIISRRCHQGSSEA